MDAYVKAFWLPKDGSSEDEYEDAFFPRHAKSLTGERLRFAVADGATEASFSRLWARMLVRAFVRGTINLPLTLAELAPLQELWSESVHGKTLPWYAEEKAASGAFAALIGLELSEERSERQIQRHWRAVAAGDSCLVQIANDKLVCSFPITDPSRFNNQPNLLGSLPDPVDADSLISEIAGSWAREDQFFLMSDALACWFLKQTKEQENPWLLLQEMEDQPAFRDFIAKLRTNQEIKNDDVTFMKIVMT